MKMMELPIVCYLADILPRPHWQDPSSRISFGKFEPIILLYTVPIPTIKQFIVQHFRLHRTIPSFNIYLKTLVNKTIDLAVPTKLVSNDSSPHAGTLCWLQRFHYTEISRWPTIWGMWNAVPVVLKVCIMSDSLSSRFYCWSSRFQQSIARWASLSLKFVMACFAVDWTLG